MTTFHKYCQAAVAILNTQYQATSVIQHNGTVGSIREQLIKDFLTNHLPELISVLSGQIFDSRDNFSKQQDVVLVLKSTPRLPFASANDLIFQEGVVASIEIKTRLDAMALTLIGSNIQSVRKLVGASSVTAQMGVNHKWPLTRILTAIICYEGMSFDNVVFALNNLEEDARPDLVLDLTQGLLVRNHGLLVDNVANGVIYVRYNDAAEGFRMFLTFLTEITGTLSARGVAWRSYWR